MYYQGAIVNTDEVTVDVYPVIRTSLEEARADAKLLHSAYMNSSWDYSQEEVSRFTPVVQHFETKKGYKVIMEQTDA